MAGRFLTQEDMAIVKWDSSVRDSMVKRGEFKQSNHTAMCVCGCGVVGCIFEYDAAKYLTPKVAPKPPQPKK